MKHPISFLISYLKIIKLVTCFTLDKTHIFLVSCLHMLSFSPPNTCYQINCHNCILTEYCETVFGWPIISCDRMVESSSEGSETWSDQPTGTQTFVFSTSEIVSAVVNNILKNGKWNPNFKMEKKIVLQVLEDFVETIRCLPFCRLTPFYAFWANL